MTPAADPTAQERRHGARAAAVAGARFRPLAVAPSGAYLFGGFHLAITFPPWRLRSPVPASIRPDWRWLIMQPEKAPAHPAAKPM